MDIALPEFDGQSVSKLDGLDGNATDGIGSPWGWIGAVNRANDAHRESFLRAVQEGDFETARQYQDVGGDLLFAVARVSADEVTVVLLEKVAEPIAPALVGTWEFKNEGVQVIPSKTSESDRLLQTTRLSWKESLLAVLRSLRS